MNVAYVFYSHYEYSDVWPVLFGQSQKYLKNKKKYLLTNSVGNFSIDGWNTVLYDDSLPYQKRVSSCLEKIEEEIIIFHHEDMFLLKQPKFEKIMDLCLRVKKKEFDIIKFGRAQYNNDIIEKLDKNIYRNPANLKYAIQPSIVSRKNLLRIYRATLGNTIWEFERNSSNFVDYVKLNSCFYYEDEDSKRGLFHWDSGIYPYIATAVVKGKWDYQCYKRELSSILKEYDINPQIRGTNE